MRCLFYGFLGCEQVRASLVRGIYPFQWNLIFPHFKMLFLW